MHTTIADDVVEITAVGDDDGCDDGDDDDDEWRKKSGDD